MAIHGQQGSVEKSLQEDLTWRRRHWQKGNFCTGKNIYIQKSPQELDLETHTTDWLQNGYMPIYVGSVINMKCTISSPMQNEKWD